MGTVGGWIHPDRPIGTVVYTLDDLPLPVGGVITLTPDETYYIAAHVDLEGNRLVCGLNTTILGASSENCSLTSTGLGASDYLIYSDYTLPIRHITIKDVSKGVGINIAGDNPDPVALDWTGVNFSGCVINCTFGDIDNFIFSKGAILGSGAMEFVGAAGTIGIDNSIFTGDGSAYAMINVASTAVVTRRLRVVYSAFVAFGSTVAINVDPAATIPTDNYILDACNFSGGGTYLTGLGTSFTDNQPRWTNNRGILNTAYVASYHMRNNATPTVILATNTPVKVAGTTIAGVINQKFTHTDNRLTYVGELIKNIRVTAIASFTSANNQVVGLYIAKTGVELDDSEMYATTNAGGRAESITVQVVTTVANGDYIEIWIENTTAANNITVEYLNLVIEGLD